MPAPVSVKINAKYYTVLILNEEMDQIAQQIQSAKDDIRSLNNHLNVRLAELNALNKALLALFIQQTGSFPTLGGNGGNFGGNGENEDRR